MDEDASPPATLQTVIKTKSTKVRRYSITYLDFGFTTSPHDVTRPMCLLCGSVFSNEAMKPSRLKDHFTRMHPNEINTDFKKLREAKAKQPTITSMLSRSDPMLVRGLTASYNISLLIAKSGKSHTIGESLIRPAIKEIIETVMQRDSSSVLSTIPLSNDSVKRRIDEMGADVEKQLVTILAHTKHSLQIDESTLRDNESLLLGFVRFVFQSEIQEEMLFALNLPTDTKGSTIFDAVKTFYEEKGIPLKNVIQCATDGAPAMIGRHRGFIAFLKRDIPDILTIHCVIHRQHLVAQELSPELHCTLKIVIKCVNKIKAHALNTRLFRKLCQENDEEFERLLLHTEVRWLSKGQCLTRFYSLLDSVIEFLRKSSDPSLADSAENMKNDIAYLADIFHFMNEVNKKLQGNMTTLIQCRNIIASFIERLIFYEQKMARGEYRQFVNLCGNAISEEESSRYCCHLRKLVDNLKERYKDLLQLDIPSWIIRPFDTDPAAVKIHLQEHIIDLRNDEEAKIYFKAESYEYFWCKFMHRYPVLWEEAMMWILSFPTSYLVERGFSAVTYLLNKQRNRLSIEKRGDLRLFLTKMIPDINQLIKQHQAHPAKQ